MSGSKRRVALIQYARPFTETIILARPEYVCIRKTLSTMAKVERDLRNQTLYETVRAVHQRNVLNGLAPVLWRIDDDRANDKQTS